MKRLFLTVLLIVSVLVFMSEGMSAFAEPVVLKNSETGKGAEEEQTDTSQPEPDRSLQDGTLIYGMTPVYPGDFADGEYKVDVISSSQFFKITDADLTKKDDMIKAVITLSSTSYAYIYPGTAAEAEAAGREKWIAADESTGYGRFDLDVPALNKEMPCAAFSKKKQKWYDRDIVFLASSLPEDSLEIDLNEEGGTIIDTQEAALKVIYIAIAIIVAGGIINHFIKKKYYE